MKDITKPYIIGETAYIHEGDFHYLLRMIDEIAEIGLEAVKFHLLFNIESYMSENHPFMGDLKKYILSKKQWDDIFDYSRSKGLDIIALCDDVESAKYIIAEKKDIFGLEIHSTGLNDYHLLEAVSKFRGFILLGISGSPIDEILYAVNFLKEKNMKNIVLLYGFQSFPTDYRDINLSKMLSLKDIFRLPIGYADHTAFDSPYNEVISVMPASMGFHILEKHFALDYGKKRVDYEAAVSKESLIRIKELMKVVLEVSGKRAIDNMSKAELNYGKVGPMKKAIVAKKFIRKGEKLNLSSLWFKRTRDESPIKQKHFLDLVGLEAVKDIEKDEIIDFSKLKGVKDR